jgi:hypothetical protein
LFNEEFTAKMIDAQGSFSLEHVLPHGISYLAPYIKKWWIFYVPGAAPLCGDAWFY